MKRPIRIAITGAAGNIGYALAFRIAGGDMLGPDQPVTLQLLEIPPAKKALDGVAMELRDCAFPLLHDIVTTDRAEEAFQEVDVALLVGAKPRGAGMERKDLLLENAKIFAEQGRALNTAASADARILVVGNPANTNALITSANAPKFDRKQITGMMRLDHNRALAQLSAKTSTHVTDIRQMVVWGNHSSTQYPDISHCLVKERPATDLVDQRWYRDTFIPTIQQRGAAIIKARGASSAASAASSAIDHVRTWMSSTPDHDWTSMAVASDGSYGVAEGIFYSVPVRCNKGSYEVVQGLTIDDFSRERMKATEQELREEREAIADLL